MEPVNQMSYDEALAKVKAQGEPEPGFIRLKLGYNTYLVLPHARAIEMLALMGQGELMEDNYDKPPVVRGLDTGDIEFYIMSARSHREAHMAQLMGIPIRDLHKEDPPF